MISNGKRLPLTIDGVYDGMAGVQGNQLAFMPNRTDRRAGSVAGAVLDGLPVILTRQRDTGSGLWVAGFEVVQ